MGIEFKGFEERALELFQEIERSQVEKEREERLRKKGKGRVGVVGSRELRSLISSINYDRVKGERMGKGSVVDKIA